MSNEKRPKRRIMVDLAEDNIELLDDCAAKLGVSRSVLLQLVIDGFGEHIQTYTDGLMRGYYFKHEFERVEEPGK
jgi:hypothetical protein